MIELLTLLKPIISRKKVVTDWETTIGQQLFPNAKSPVNRLEQCCSQLKRYAEQFLIIQHIQTDTNHSQQWLLQALQARKAITAYKYTEAEVLRKLEQQPTRDIAYYQTRFELSHQQHINPYLQIYSAKNAAAEMAMDHADYLFVLNKLRYSCELYAKEQVLVKSYPIKLLSEAQALAVSEWGLKNPLLKLYNKILYFHQYADATEGFQEIINDFMTHRSLLGQVEQTFVLSNLMNLANWRLQLDRPTFLEILSQLYDIGLKINVFIIDGVLSDTTFLNILANKAEVKEYEKVIDLMEKYQRFLLEKYREIALDFGQAYIHL